MGPAPEVQTIAPTLLLKIIFDTSQNTIWSHVLHAALSFRQCSSWATRMFGFLTQELTDQAQDPGKFVSTVYLRCYLLFSCEVFENCCCIWAYSVSLQGTTESNGKFNMADTWLKVKPVHLSYSIAFHV